MVNLIEADEVSERVGVFPIEKPGKDTQRLIVDARLSNLHFLHPPGVSLATSEGLSRVEVALENGDVGPGRCVEIGRFAHGPDQCERCLSQIQDLKTVQLLFLPFLRWKVRKYNSIAQYE